MAFVEKIPTTHPDIRVTLTWDEASSLLDSLAGYATYDMRLQKLYKDLSTVLR